MIKIVKNTASVLVILTLLVSVQIAGAQSTETAPVQTQAGKLLGVTGPSNGPDANGRCEYEVSMNIDGQIYYFTMWMTPQQATGLRNDIGKHIFLDYKWVNGKRIYIGHDVYWDPQHDPSQNFESGGNAQ